jgi:protein ImuB
MAFRGCINVDRLPLQVLLKKNPGWKGTPVAVTKDERPQSPILSMNREARDRGLSVGMKYAAALSLVPSLKARAVPAASVDAARGRIVKCLSAFTPDIEPCPFDPDASWVSVEGLRSLFTSESRWLDLVRRALLADGFRANVILGFTRFGTYALARSQPRSIVFSSLEEEQEMVGRSPVDILPLSRKTLDLFQLLEIRTVRQFVALPAGETLRRFGKEAGRLHASLLSDDPLPIQAVPLKEKKECRRRLDSPLSALDLLLEQVDDLLSQEVARAAAEGAVISELTLLMRTEEGDLTEEVIRPAIPTLEQALLRRLVQFRLSSRQLTSGVADIELRSLRARPSHRQEELFVARKRDLEAGARAFAAIKARFGNQSVTRAELVDAHHPEKSYRWTPMDRPVLPSPRPAGGTVAIRRIFETPRPCAGKGELVAGPFLLSGSWWEDAACAREYSLRESSAGILWLFVDTRSGITWNQGTVD